MRILQIILPILLLFFLLGQIRIGLLFVYDREGIRLRGKLGGVHFALYPMPPRETKRGKKKKKEKPEEVRSAREKIGGTLEYAKQLLPVALEAAGQFHQKMRMDVLELELTAAAKEPADAAMVYGAACAALGTFWEPLVETFHVKDGQAHAAVDFEQTQTLLYVNGQLTLKLGQLLWLALHFGAKALVAASAAGKVQQGKTEPKMRKAG